MIDAQNFFDQPVKSNSRACDSVPKIAIDQRDDYTTFYQLDCNYFKIYSQMITINLTKQQALDADPKAIQQIKFRGKLKNNARYFSSLKKRKNSFRFFIRNCKSILTLFFALIQNDFNITL